MCLLGIILTIIIIIFGNEGKRIAKCVRLHKQDIGSEFQTIRNLIRGPNSKDSDMLVSTVAHVLGLLYI